MLLVEYMQSTSVVILHVSTRLSVTVRLQPSLLSDFLSYLSSWQWEESSGNII